MYFHRRSIRLYGYDYSENGYYFVTIDLQDKKDRFGKIVNKEMLLSEFGLVVDKLIREIPKFYKGVNVDEYVVMPDHVHLIIYIVGADPRICPNNLSLADIIQRFKILSTNKYIEGVKKDGWPRFRGKLWQRNYYERIIRNENEHYRIREYIRNNPQCYGFPPSRCFDWGRSRE